MKILVTGANGFVGTHLVRHLLDAGHSVTSVVRSPGTAPSGSTELVTGSIGPDSDWSGLLVGHQTVIHLAARVHVMDDRSDDPLQEFRVVNTAGTAVLATAAAAQGVSRFVFLSSVKVFGEGRENNPYTATDTPHPVEPYGVSKWEAETLLREIERNSSLEVVIVRTPLVYGPGVGGNFIRLLQYANLGVPLPLASIRNRRTMTSVWNLNDLLERCTRDSELSGALVLAGDALSPSTPQLLREISLAMKKRSVLFAFPPALLRSAGFLLGKSVVIERLAGSLEVKSGSDVPGWKWTPPMTFSDSIQRTVDWYEGQRS